MRCLLVDLPTFGSCYVIIMHVAQYPIIFQVDDFFFRRDRASTHTNESHRQVVRVLRAEDDLLLRRSGLLGRHLLLYAGCCRCGECAKEEAAFALDRGDKKEHMQQRKERKGRKTVERLPA